MGNIFNDDFRDFIIALNQAKVKYVLIGGYSVIYHGFSRTTGDLDLFVEVSSTNYNCLKDAYTRFGLALFDMTEFNFLHNEAIDVFSFGRPPVSIDLTKYQFYNFSSYSILLADGLDAIEGNVLFKKALWQAIKEKV